MKKKAKTKVRVPDYEDVWKAIDDRDDDLRCIAIKMEKVDLSERDKDLALRSAIENRTMAEWAEYYHLSTSQVERILNKPEVKEVIREVRRDVRQYMLVKSAAQIQTAFKQFDEIFSLETTYRTAETKRRAAVDVISFWNQKERVGNPTEERLPDNSNVIEVKGVASLDAIVQSAKEEIKGLDTLREQILSLESQAQPTVMDAEVVEDECK